MERLRLRGHHAVAPDLPFDEPEADYEERARPALEALRDIDGPVVVVGHSVGSAEAALVAARRPPALLVYVCPRFGSFPTPPVAPDVFRKGFPFPPKDVRGRSVWEPESAVAAMYGRLPREKAQQLAKRLRPGASPVAKYPLSSHPDVLTALIYTTEDEFFTPEWERFVAEHLLRIAPVELPGGHFPMVENADLLAGTLDALVVEAERRESSHLAAPVTPSDA